MSATPRPRRRWRALAATVAVAGLASAPTALATELWRRGEASVDLSGTVRELLTTSNQTDRHDFERALQPAVGRLDCVPPGLVPPPLAAGDFEDCAAFKKVGEDRVWQSLTRVRLQVDWTAASWLSGSIVADNELRLGELDTLEQELSRGLESSGWVDAEDTIASNDTASWRTVLYRGFARAELGRAEAIVGRQRVAWGVGRLWNPIDRFNAIPPLAIEGDESPGVDAVLARWNFDGFHWLEAVYAPGSNGDETRYAVRLHGVWLDTDLSLMGGVFERAPAAGFDLARNLGDAAVRVEAVFTDPEESFQPVGASHPSEPGQYWQVVASIDYNLDVGNGVYLLAEHLYNGNALGFGHGEAGTLLPLIQNDGTTSRAVFGGSQVVTNAIHQTGFEVATDLVPELRGDLLTIVDWNGGSVVVYPSLAYSPLGSLELRVGAQIGIGPRLSQYGDVGTLGFFLADFYF